MDSQMTPLKLFLVHCGFYDTDVLDGVYESHVNFLVPAESFEDARAKVKLESDFQRKRMHVDGLQQIDALRGYRIELTIDPILDGKTIITSSRHRELAPKKTETPG